MKKLSKNQMIYLGSFVVLLVIYLVFRKKINRAVKKALNRGGQMIGVSEPDLDLVLKKGDKGPEVTLLQERLLSDGQNLGTYGPLQNGVDGDFGEVTEAALLDEKGVSSISINDYDKSSATILPVNPVRSAPLAVAQ